MNRADSQRLAEIRLAEAKALLATGHPSGAYYLAGYAVECGLKACLARRTKEHDFPPGPDRIRDIYSHKIAKLTQESGLADEWKLRRADPATQSSFAVIERWNEQSRHEVRTEAAAREQIQAIDDPEDGVMTWMTSHW